MPKVSVIIPTYNRTKYICETIDSVLAQTYKNYEIIVVDDGSTDNTKEVLANYSEKIKYLYQENKGLSAARNSGIKNSNGEYIAFLDDDDLWLPEKLERQVDALDKNPDLAFVCSESYVIDECGNIVNLWRRGRHNKETFESLYEENFVSVLTVLLRRKHLYKVGLFDESLRGCEDYDLWLRLVKKYKFKYLDSPLAKYQVHKNQMSRDLDLIKRIHEDVVNRQKFAKNISFIRRRLSRAKTEHLFGKHYYGAQRFSKAGFCYLKSILNFPLVGYYYWPKETENFRLSLPYRILKPYLLTMICWIKFMSNKCWKNKIQDILTKIKLIIFKTVILSIIPIIFLNQKFKKLFKVSKNTKIGFLNIEYFHKEIGVYGGYGMCGKNISNYFNTNGNKIKVEVVLTRPMDFKKPKIKQIDNTNMVFHSDHMSPGIRSTIQYARLIDSRNFDLLLTMEYYSSYFYTIALLPTTPLVIWIHDPRPEEELQKISTVPLAKMTDIKNRNKNIQDYERRTLKRLISLRKVFGRQIVFGTTAYCLIEKAKKTYNLSNLNPVFLPTPVQVPNGKIVKYSSRPSFCFLGRLDPIKRPWIFFELAKKFKGVDFLVAGKTHFPNIMNSMLNKYRDVKNLKFLGLTVGREKDDLLKNIWGIINTSIHEALPVSFLESLAYGKPIISCQNPDDLVSKFGVYTGQILGNGNDSYSVGLFVKALEKVLSQRNSWKEKAILAREHIESLYSFQKFENCLNEIIRY